MLVIRPCRTDGFSLCRNWELTAPWTNTPIHTKVLFIAGKDDLVLDFPGSMAFVMVQLLEKQCPTYRRS